MEPPSIVNALAAVMAELPATSKDDKSPEGYSYRGIEAITKHLQPLLAKHSVVIVPSATLQNVVPRRGGVLMPSLLDAVAMTVVFLAFAQVVVCGFAGMALAQAKVPPRARVVVMSVVVVLTAALVVAGAVVMYDAAWVDYRRRR